MPDATFYEEVRDGETRYVCCVPFSTQPGGICGHWSRDFTLFRQHMEQQHTGALVQGEPPAPEPEPAPEPDEGPEPEKEPVQATAPAAPAASEPIEA